jgi:hypothetical protein
VIDEVLEEIEASITQGRVRGLPELRRDPARLSTAVQTRLARNATMAIGRAGRDPQGSRPLWAAKRTCQGQAAIGWS